MNMYGTPVMFDGEKMPETHNSNTLFPFDRLKTIHLPVSRHFNVSKQPEDAVTALFMGCFRSLWFNEKMGTSQNLC